MIRFVSMVLSVSCACACSGPAAEEVSTAQLDQALECVSNTGINHAKARLAVAMGLDMGAWDPLRYLRKGDSVTLSAEGEAYCNTHFGCPSVRMYLDLQREDLRITMDQNVFNPTSYREDLKASFDRQLSLDRNLRQNNPGSLPEPHKLVGFGTGSDLGGCGFHQGFHLSKPDGTPVAKPANIANRLAFFGYGGYGGNNPYIDFRVIGNDVYIDPPAEP